MVRSWTNKMHLKMIMKFTLSFMQMIDLTLQMKYNINECHKMNDCMRWE